jgi:hypothetical protein
VSDLTDRTNQILLALSNQSLRFFIQKIFSPNKTLNLTYSKQKTYLSFASFASFALIFTIHFWPTKITTRNQKSNELEYSRLIFLLNKKMSFTRVFLCWIFVWIGLYSCCFWLFSANSLISFHCCPFLLPFFVSRKKWCFLKVSAFDE